MKRGRLPLTALRSFEVAARLRSFTRAADELLISQSAVSRQVRELERQLGQPLFERRHRMVVLTSSGETLLAVLTASFDAIGTSLDRLKANKPASSLSISVEPSFAAGWLAPRLASFRRLQPDIDLLLDVDPRPVEFRAGRVEIAVRHSAMRTEWPRVECQWLADVTMIPVIAPNLLSARGPVTKPTYLLQFPLLHEDNRDLWHRWFTAAGAQAGETRGSVYPDGALILQATLRGEGIALMDRMFIRDELMAGELVQPFDTTIPHGAYWLVARSFADLSPQASVFVDWLKTALISQEPSKGDGQA